MTTDDAWTRIVGEIGAHWYDFDGQPCSLERFAELRQSPEFRVGQFTSEKGDVSTVYLGLNHRFGGEGPPIIYETLVFGGALDQEMDRYCTRAEAEAGHAAMVERVLAS